jgi:hypothetical protein
MADAIFLATYLKISVDYEFEIETAIFNYTSFHFRAVLTETHSKKDLFILYTLYVTYFLSSKDLPKGETRTQIA